MNTAPLSNWLEIDLDAIRSNVGELRRISGVKVMAIVKANGYGHGIIEAGTAALQGGADWLGVARIEEALALRAAGVTHPLLVLGYSSPLQAAEAALHDVSLAVYDLELAEAYAREAKKTGRRIKIHAKFDTGMGRLGVFPEEGLAFMKNLARIDGLEIEGMFTHFARSDEPEMSHNRTGKISAFKTWSASWNRPACARRWFMPPIRRRRFIFQKRTMIWYAAGSRSMGCSPSAEAPLPETFRPALSWKAHLSSVKYLPANHGVGYSHRYTTQAVERIGVVPVGYADGLRRRVGNFALVGGKRVKAAGGSVHGPDDAAAG